MKSYTEQIIEAGPGGFDEVLQTALNEMRGKNNRILLETHPMDQPILAAALYLSSQVILHQTGEPAKRVYDLTLERCAAMAVPHKGRSEK